MKTLSKWAKANPHKSRFIIVISHILMILNACLLGVLTYWVDVEIPYWLSFTLANLFFICWVIYPQKKLPFGFFKYTYQRQKTLDFLLITVGALVVAGGVNYAIFNLDEEVYVSTSVSETVSPSVSFIASAPNDRTISREEKKLRKKELKQTKKAQKKNFKAKLKELKSELKKHKKEDGGIIATKIGLIILALAATIGLGYLVAALACTVACSGAGFGGWAILILGWGGLIWLLVFAIIKILQKVGSKKKAEG